MVQRGIESGFVSSAKKKVVAASRITELGAQLDGEKCTLGVSTSKLVKIMLATLWLLGQKMLNRKHLQIIAGRWLFVLQFRRPAMSILQHTWTFIAGTTRITSRLRENVKSELWSLVCLANTLQCNLGATISPQLIVTDASTTGGAVGCAVDVSGEGVDFVEANRLQELADASGKSPNFPVQWYWWMFP